MAELPTECMLCPRACGVNRAAGQRGVCGGDDTLRVARAALHFWEEPALSGESGSGAVFFSNCPMHCVYCQNAVIADGQAGVPISVERLTEIFFELEAQGALNLNMVTPTHYTPQIIQAVADARARGLTLPVVWNTSGYETVETIRSLAGTVDVYLADFKYASPALAAALSNAPDYPEVALAAIQEMVDQVGEAQYDEYRGQERMVRGVVVRHLLLPGFLDASMDAVALLHERFGSAVRLSLMNQYTPVIAQDSKAARAYPQLLETVPWSDYDILLDFADTIGIEDYDWQDGPAALESFIPAFDCSGVLASGQAGEEPSA